MGRGGGGGECIGGVDGMVGGWEGVWEGVEEGGRGTSHLLVLVKKCLVLLARNSRCGWPEKWPVGCQTVALAGRGGSWEVFMEGGGRGEQAGGGKSGPPNGVTTPLPKHITSLRLFGLFVMSTF